MKAKKILSAILIGVAAMSLVAGCSGAGADSKENTEEKTTKNESGTEITTENSKENSGDTSDSGNVLVVYYSATGNTEGVAKNIAQATGGDLFKLEPAEPYTDDDLDWTNEESRVSREHENEDERDVELASTTVEGFEDYSVVYLGYPVWWGIAAWPVNQFVENNDFTGKTVIPFCTSASSGIGNSGQLLEEMAGTGNWLEGQRFQSSVSEEDVVAWVDSLGL